MGVMFKNDLKPTLKYYQNDKLDDKDLITFAITSPTSRKSEHRPKELRAKKSSISRVPMLYPIFSSCLFTSE